MGHGHAHEEAEHAQHHSHDRFDKRIAMTMMVIAAVLAAVKVMAHRAHNATLAYQIKANVMHTQASDLWNFFQNKRQRLGLAELEAQLLQNLVNLPISPDKNSDKSLPLPRREQRQTSITKDLSSENVPEPETKAQEIVKKGEQLYHRLLQQGYSSKQAERIADLQMTSDRYKLETQQISEKAKKASEKGKSYAEQSDKTHHKADYLDIAELLVELGLVLCSVAILSKQNSFWYGGVGVAIAGLIVMLLGGL